jgi:hypothetical protein
MLTPDYSCCAGVASFCGFLLNLSFTGLVRMAGQRLKQHGVRDGKYKGNRAPRLLHRSRRNKKSAARQDAGDASVPAACRAPIRGQVSGAGVGPQSLHNSKQTPCQAGDRQPAREKREDSKLREFAANFPVRRLMAKLLCTALILCSISRPRGWLPFLREFYRASRISVFAQEF